MITEPDLERDGWELESAVDRNRRNPETFPIPSEEERAQLLVGQPVKLLFLLLGHDDHGQFLQCERMWVTVTEVNPDGYVGRLESTPQTSDVLKPGDLIPFYAEDVASVLAP